MPFSFTRPAPVKAAATTAPVPVKPAPVKTVVAATTAPVPVKPAPALSTAPIASPRPAVPGLLAAAATPVTALPVKPSIIAPAPAPMPITAVTAVPELTHATQGVDMAQISGPTYFGLPTDFGGAGPGRPGLSGNNSDFSFPATIRGPLANGGGGGGYLPDPVPAVPVVDAGPGTGAYPAFNGTVGAAGDAASGAVNTADPASKQSGGWMDKIGLLGVVAIGLVVFLVVR